MTDLIKINYESSMPTVSGRELYKALEIKTEYKKWFERMSEYGFAENEDFVKVTQKCLTSSTGQNVTDHQLTIPMAKEICMLQRNDKGKQFRKYFIKVEEAWNSPEMVMKRALDYANQKIAALTTTADVSEQQYTLTQEEQKELEALKNDPLVKLANTSIRKGTDPEKKKLYQLRWLRKKGQQIAKELESELGNK